MSVEKSRSSVRLWPMLVLLALAAVAILVVWVWPNAPRQQRYIRTAVVLFWAAIAGSVWLLFLSRLRWRVRLGVFAGVALLAAAVPLLFKIRGVTGDLLPILEPRWKVRRPQIEARTPTASAHATNTPSASGEFTQFYGPQRNASLRGPELETNWTAQPPEILWRQPVGAAWSGFAVKDGLAVTLEQRGDSEVVAAYDLLSGRTIWTHTDAVKYSTTIAGEGPRTTPTISSNRVYTFGATGLLNCLALESGKLIWSRDTAKENGARVPDWGFASSPLVVDGRVVVSVGGTSGRSLVAYSTDDGSPSWSDGESAADYSSPVEATLLGQRQILLFAGSIIGRDLNGKTLWSYPWPGGHPHITPPLVVSSNQFFVSSGYGTGCALVRLERTATGGWKTEREWKTLAIKSKFAPLFRQGEYVYGLDDGIFCCVELKTGHRQWKDGRYGHGQGLLVGSKILLTSEKGELVLIEPDPEKLVELARFAVFDDKTWNPPALAGEYLLMRNDKEAACLKLRVKKELEKS